MCAACGGVKLCAEPNALQKVSSFFIIVNAIDDKVGRAIKFFSFQGIQSAFVAESPNSFGLIFSKWINPNPTFWRFLTGIRRIQFGRLFEPLDFKSFWINKHREETVFTANPVIVFSSATAPKVSFAWTTFSLVAAQNIKSPRQNKQIIFVCARNV